MKKASVQIAYLYIRVSTDEQAERGYSQRDQEERLRKYCEINGITVEAVFFEDHSAKTFKRPEWIKLLTQIKKNRNRTSLVLFTKWDRFSRNTGDAYQAINLLNKLGADPQAVEQPLDLSIPENKMMLAFYLAVPEVENLRRALNVFHGMRRAKKEGRWMATAPIGFKNKSTEEGKKYIAPHETSGPIMQWAFKELASGKFNTEQIWKMVRQKGLKCSKNNFWVAIRNPVYCGKIVIPPFKDEAGYVTRGQHEPLITESLYYQVQDVLDGRKRNPANKPKVVSVDNLPLRGFLKCPKCNRMLTGSASKGKYDYYYYYHCTSRCGIRFKAGLTNDLFLKELKSFIPNPKTLKAYTDVVIHDFKRSTKLQDTERRQILAELENINKRMQNARVMKVDGSLDDDDFQSLKTDSNKRTEELERQLGNVSGNHTEITSLLEKGLKNLSGLDLMYQNGSVAEKRKIISSIFPENLVFDGIRHRTPRINEGVRLIYQKYNELEGKEKGTSLHEVDLSHQVIPLGSYQKS